MSDNKPKRFPWTFKVGADNKPTVLTVIRRGIATTIQAGSKFFKEIYDGLVTGDHQKVDNYVNLKQAIAEFSNGAFKMYDNVLTYKGQELHNAAAERVLELYRLGKDSLPIVNFLERVLRNPSESAQRELFLFLEHNDLPITDEGYFLAYKMVRHDFKDKYTGRMDNSVGATPKMDRNACDPNRGNVCSRGLHFCSLEYVEKGSYGSVTSGDHLVVLRVDPEHVVSIPSDYHNSKGRACEYFILKEIEWTDRLKKWTASEDSVVASPEDDFDPEEVSGIEEEHCENCGELVDYCRCDDEVCGECGENYEDCRCGEEEEHEEEEEHDEPVVTEPAPVSTPTPAMKQVKPGESKLTASDLESIDKLLAMKKPDGSQLHTYTHLGKMYNVHRSTIQRYHAKKVAAGRKRKK